MFGYTHRKQKASEYARDQSRMLYDLIPVIFGSSGLSHDDFTYGVFMARNFQELFEYILRTAEGCTVHEKDLSAVKFLPGYKEILQKYVKIK